MLPNTLSVTTPKASTKAGGITAAGTGGTAGGIAAAGTGSNAGSNTGLPSYTPEQKPEMINQLRNPVSKPTQSSPGMMSSPPAGQAFQDVMPQFTPGAGAANPPAANPNPLANMQGGEGLSAIARAMAGVPPVGAEGAAGTPGTGLPPAPLGATGEIMGDNGRAARLQQPAAPVSAMGTPGPVSAMGTPGPSVVGQGVLPPMDTFDGQGFPGAEGPVNPGLGQPPLTESEKMRMQIRSAMQGRGALQ